MNIVVIISDTLRRDYLGCYGNQTVRTPHLDEFAKRSVVFDRAYVASFPTMPMRADLYTGKFTLTYLGCAPMPRDEVILHQLLTDAGYVTAAVVDTPFYVRNGFGYDRGFHDFRMVRGQWWEREVADTTYERRYEEDHCAPMTGAYAERWLERHYQEKFFLYVDMWDPHEPWDPPLHYGRQYYPDWDGTIVKPPYYYWSKSGLTRKDIDIARACYAGEVTMVDRAVGRIIERLESLGILEKTIIVFVSDHGYLLGEHELLGKMILEDQKYIGAPLYEEITRVPLLIHFPGADPCRTDAIVSTPDLMPTILDLVGIEIPNTVQAKSMASIVRTGKGEGRSFAVTATPLYNPGQTTHIVDSFRRRIKEYLYATITSDVWTLLYACKGKPVELYNLESDPGQKKNVAKQHPEVVKSLHRMFFNLIWKVV